MEPPGMFWYVTISYHLTLFEIHIIDIEPGKYTDNQGHYLGGQTKPYDFILRHPGSKTCYLLTPAAQMNAPNVEENLRSPFDAPFTRSFDSLHRSMEDLPASLLGTTKSDATDHQKGTFDVKDPQMV